MTVFESFLVLQRLLGCCRCIICDEKWAHLSLLGIPAVQAAKSKVASRFEKWKRLHWSVFIPSDTVFFSPLWYRHSYQETENKATPGSHRTNVFPSPGVLQNKTKQKHNEKKWQQFLPIGFEFIDFPF